MDGITNVCEATSQSLDFESFRPTHRKGKKLLAEKKRRARINNCLMRIRDIVCDGEEEKETDLDKMEKAEILERTLEVLTRVRHDLNSTRKIGTLSTQKAMAFRYASGFSSCAEESIRYIQNSRLVPQEVKYQLQAHLRSIAHRMESRVEEEQGGNYTHSYTPASVVIAPPQIVPLSTVPTHPPNSSLSLILPVHNDAQVQSSPSRNINFQTSSIQNTIQSSKIEMSSSEMYWKHPSIPSPIHTSTPVTHIDEINKPVSPMQSKVFYKENSSVFIPVSVAELSHDLKENQPNDYHSNILVLSDRSQHRSQVNSAFHKIPPRHCKSSSPRVIKEETQQLRKSSSSSSPTFFSSSQYSPISPMASPVPVIVHTSTSSCSSSSTDQQPIYSYHGYEPYPTYPHSLTNNTVIMPIVGKSPSETEQPQTPNKVIDLCVRRNDSHNISPETMWRPW